MQLHEVLSRFRTDARVDYLGVAALSAARDFIRDQGGDDIACLPTAVSVGIALPNAIVDLLPRRQERAVQVGYRTHAYEVINQRLDLISSEIASSLQKEGFRALPVPAAERVDEERNCASFSHKLAANLSGLGWIGKSCLVVTPEHGPRVRWSTVLTDAPATAHTALMPDRCGSCSRCVDVCPVQAFTGKRFTPHEPREVRYAADKCDMYFREMASRGDLKVCGMCLYACPFGTDRHAAADAGL